MLDDPAETTNEPTDSADDAHHSFADLLRETNRVFNGEFARLVPSTRNGNAYCSPLIAETERISLDFLARGGKRVRPFVTLAAYQSHIGEVGANQDIPAHVKRAAIAIEAFHKASLVHDDIEDGDLFRYGRETLHRQHDTATAINVGDYLIGLGYRLITGDRMVLGSERASDILHCLMDAHVRLSEGQGAELAWRRRNELRLTADDVLNIYGLKTSPAFEAALYTGVRLAGDGANIERTISDFCGHLGVAFQVLNDLKDWVGDDDNKLVAGQDAVALRPTLLLAFALESANASQTSEIERMLASLNRSERDARRLRSIFQSLGVFERAKDAVARSRRSAIDVAEGLKHDGLRRLFHYLMATVLAPAEQTSMDLSSRSESPSPNIAARSPSSRRETLLPRS